MTLQWAAAGGDRLDRDNPWPGLASYEESSHEFFSGRAAEADDLQRRIVGDPVTVLFGKSGLGKTSLLKAGVFPRLRERGLLPILLRLQVQPDAAPLVEQARLAMFEALRSGNIDHPEAEAAETLWEYLHRTRQEFWTSQNRLVRPVFVFDQFEELYTLGRAVPSAVDRFREDLADLAENRIPAALAQRLGERAPVELGLDVQAMPYKIVVALREDFLADLEEWRLSMPSLRRNRMRLLPMRPDQALEAVFNPRTSHLVSEALARRIVAFLSSGAGDADGAGDAPGDDVEPALLSLFCRGVNEHRKRDRKPAFDEALVEGGKGTIVADFYRASVGDQPERVRCFIEDELITEHGFRNSYAIESAIAKGLITDAELATLINRHLLRHEHHLGTDRVELTHDLLTRAVAEGRDERRLAERARRERRQRWKALGVVAGLAAAALTFLALWLRAGADRDAARSRELVALSGSMLNHNPELSIALALEALRGVESSDARSALLNAAQYAWPSVSLGVDQLGDGPTALALSADGNRLVVLARTGILTEWDLAAGEPGTALWKVTIPDATTLAFSPDAARIAVTRTASVDLLNAASGRTVAALPADLEQDRNRALVVFSPDGRWLGASLSQQRLQTWEQRDDAWVALPPPPVPVGLSGFALLAGGQRIVAVAQPSGEALAAYGINRKADGSWSKPSALDVSECMAPQSVSQGAVYFSATWNPRACTFDAAADRSAPTMDSMVISDIVWSAQGQGFAQLLPQERSLDLIVGRQQQNVRLESHVKGAHPNETTSEKSHLISVSDAGTRVAVIDDDDDKLVRIYWLAHYKPFLSRLPTSSFVLAPDAGWMATASASQDQKSATIDVVPIAQALAPHPARATARIALDRVPDLLFAGDGAVIVTWNSEPWMWSAYDAATGKPRVERRAGYAQPIGRDGSLLLATSSDGWRVVATRDGSPVDGWLGGADTRGTIVVPSGSREALAVVRERASHRYDVSLYTVQGRTITLSGRVLDAPVDPSRLGFMVSNDGRSIMDRGAGKVWRVADARAVAQVTNLPEEPAAESSPMGTYDIQSDAEGLSIVRRADKARVRDVKVHSPRHNISPDDRWLAVWGEKPQSLLLVDLSLNEVVFEFDPHTEINWVNFVAANVVRVDFAADAMLIPLDAAMIRQVGSSLARVTDAERCLYGLNAAACHAATAAARTAPDAKPAGGPGAAQ